MWLMWIKEIGKSDEWLIVGRWGWRNEEWKSEMINGEWGDEIVG